MTKLRTIDAIRTSVQSMKKYVDGKLPRINIKQDVIKAFDVSNQQEEEWYPEFVTDTLGLIPNVEHKIIVSVDGVSYHGRFTPELYDPGYVGVVNFVEDGIENIFFDEVDDYNNAPRCLGFINLFDKMIFDPDLGEVFDETKTTIHFSVGEYEDGTIEKITGVEIIVPSEQNVLLTGEVVQQELNKKADVDDVFELLPAYDTRNTKTITYEYDKIEEGKVTACEYFQERVIQRFVKVADLTAEEFDYYAEKMKSSYDSESSYIQELEQTIGEDVYNSTFEGTAFYTLKDEDENEVNTILYANTRVYFIKQPHPVSYMDFPEPGVYFLTYSEWYSTYPIKMTINIVNGELKVIDKKYLVNSPGRIFEPYSIEYYDSDINTTFKYRSGEVFNDESNMALEFDSHAEGSETKALGSYSHTEGYRTLASGEASHAEGTNTKARGKGSHAEGFGSHALAQAAHAEGETTRAKTTGSHAEGINTIALGYGQHVQGKYNIENEYNYAHIVGNGSYDARSNAHTLDWNGNAWFAGDVFIKGTSQNDGQKLITNAELENIATITQSEFETIVAEVFNTDR